MKKLIVLTLVISIVALVGYAYYHDGTLPVQKNNPTEKVFVVEKGENVNTIARKLEQAELIRNRVIFYLVVKQLGIEKEIQAGDFQLSTAMRAEETAQALTKASQDRWLRVIEGVRKEEIAEQVSKEFPIPYAEFTKIAQEGYLFPDTYLIPKEATASIIITIMRQNFDKKLAQALQQKSVNNTLTPSQIVVLASIVEREGRTLEDRKTVASVLLRRLTEEMPLQVDASVQYVLGYQTDKKTWWKKYLSPDDIAIDSPYNTYKQKGLPPLPICNPSLSSLQAAAQADPNVPYLYYLNDSKGVMHFAKTLEEHNANVSKYLQ